MAKRKRQPEGFTESWRTEVLNILFDIRERVQGQYTVEQKKAVVIEFTRYGCTTGEIAKASGMSTAFINDTVREFSHRCLADRVKEIGHGQEQQQNEVRA